MARTRPPTRLIEPTPLTVSRRSLICLRASSVTSRRSRRPETAIVMTGIELVSNLSTIGGSVPSGRSAKNRVDLVAHFLHAHVAVLREQELNGHDRHAFGGGRPQLVDARDRVDDIFDRLGDGGLHLLDAGPLQHRRDGADREVDVGKEVDAQLAVREKSPRTTGMATRTQVKTGRLIQISDMVMITVSNN